ncbi:UNVERIFIED_CONTAM: hypothetical protein Sradi_7191000 [Sesamum radiatum]|uniref:CCHC-type domain-containing protein n=1 Tax=Sesamum radiatum TaxID=300843 RepID=A0AAW2IS92_SESRA
MTNEIQKQYDRLEDVPSIMFRLKDIYAVPDRHIRYAATKAFFGTKMTEGSFVHSHGVKMLSLVKKLDDLKAGLDNDTYIDVILQFLPPSYDPFIVNYNMNGLEKSIHELINMLVQYEATTHKSESVVLVGEASTSKAKGKGARRWKRKKGKGTTVTAIASTGGAPPAAPKGKGKGKVGGSQRSKANDVCMHCQGKGHWKRECPQLLSNPGMFMVEVNMISNSASWVLDTGCGAHIYNDLQVLERSRKLSKDEMILRLGDGKTVAAEAVGSLRLVVNSHIRIDLRDIYFVPSMGKMTKKPFVGQSAIVNGLLDLVHTDVCGPLSIPARGGFSYFITFTDDHSRYGYVYLMRYKSEAFGSGLLLELHNSMEWLKGGNRTLLDMVRSMISFTELPPSFWGYELDTAAKLLNIVPSKSVPQTPYEIWHGKLASYKYLRVWGSPAYVKRLSGDKLDSRSSLCSRHDEVLIEESNEEPHRDTTTSFEPTIHTDSVPVLPRSTRESRVPDRYGFMGLSSQLDNDPKTYGEAISDIDSISGLRAMNPNELDGFKPGSWRRDTLNNPGSTLRKFYSPVAMAKSIRILLAIAAWSIYGLKQASRSWNTRFDEVIRGYDFIKNDYDPCVYKKISGSSVAYLVLIVDDILLIGNDVKMLGDIKAWCPLSSP